MQVGTFFRCLFPVTICLAVSININASERKESQSDRQLDHPRPGQNSESYPDIVIPESVLRSRDILLQLDAGQLPELPDIAVRPELPERPDKPDRPVRPEIPAKPDRAAKPERPGRPDTPGKP